MTHTLKVNRPYTVPFNVHLDECIGKTEITFRLDYTSGGGTVLEAFDEGILAEYDRVMAIIVPAGRKHLAQCMENHVAGFS